MNRYKVVLPCSRGRSRWCRFREKPVSQTHSDPVAIVQHCTPHRKRGRTSSVEGKRSRNPQQRKDTYENVIRTINSRICYNSGRMTLEGTRSDEMPSQQLNTRLRVVCLEESSRREQNIKAEISIITNRAVSVSLCDQ